MNLHTWHGEVFRDQRLGHPGRGARRRPGPVVRIQLPELPLLHLPSVGLLHDPID